MFKKPEMICPLMRGECVQARCMWWIHIRGKNPQGGNELDLHDCAVRWLPTLLIENAQMERQTGAAVESMRNEIVARQDMSMRLQAEAQRALAAPDIYDVTPSKAN
jgi:hypothetical protein